jgi:hypothetical protein
MNTLYDLLRRLLAGGAWTEEERREAVALINQLEQSAVFGNRVAEITMQPEGD